MKVLGVFTHPDDEVIFGWPIFQNKSIDRHLIICTEGFDSNAYKVLGTIKTDAITEICKIEGIKLEWIGHSDGLHYRMFRPREDLLKPVREIQILIDTIVRIAEQVKPDFIFTHNFWGDNGNSEHRLISEIVINHCLDYNILITDRCENNLAWFSYKTIPRMHQRYFIEENVFKKCSLDADFYVRCKKVYEKYKVWTGSLSIPPVYPKKESSLYIIRKI